MKTIFFPLILSVASYIQVNSANLTHYELDVKEFSELKVVDGINVIYRHNPDSAGKAVFDSSPELASAIMFVPGKDKLEIQLTTKGVNYQSLPTVTVYSSYLSKIENAGDSTVRVMSVAPGPKFKARIIGNGALIVKGVKSNHVEASIDTGNGNLIIAGECNFAKISSTGTGQIQADELIAPSIKCSLWGTGSIGCCPTQNLSVVGAGSGQVYYLGTPEIKNRTLGVKTIPLTEGK